MPFTHFIHLHVHSEYSLLDGACRLDKLVTRARDLKFPALALTDHGALYGAVEFYHACLRHGVKPIIGMETYIAPGSRLEKSSSHGMKDAAYHLLLLARDYEGYQNLVALSTIGFLQGFYYRPRIDREVLAKHSRGLIGLSACLHGEIPSLLQKGEEPAARARAEEYQQIFGPGHFYLEIMDQGIPAQREVNRSLIALSRETGVPLVATNDVHYLRREDALAQEVLMCLQTGAVLADEKRMRLPSSEFYLKTGAEMAALFAEVPEAGRNTLEIANHCNLELPKPGLRLPHYEVPPDTPAAGPEGSRLDAYLEQLCRERILRRYPQADPSVSERLAKELAVIRQTGYAGYFLVVWDFVAYAKQQGIPVGPGRGSAAGSLVAYLLGITDIDPLRYGLLFERFLNPNRVSPPDIDVDFSDRGREDVIRYVTQKYGQENVAQIITFGTLAAKAAVRDVGRVLGYAYEDVDRWAKLIPQQLDMTLDRALETTPELAELYQGNEQVRTLVDISRALEGQVRHASTHAAGVVISPQPLVEIVPLCQARVSRGADHGEGATTLTTQYAMESLEKLGLLKMDFLGLRTLSILADALDNVAGRTGRRPDLETLPYTDEATFKLLGEARTDGVFQLESEGMRDLLKRLKPRSLEEICALIALFRPGPMAMIDDYIGRKQGRIPIEYPHPDLEPILRETHGTMIYQEQVMEIAVTLGGFSLGEADLLRRAMGKKNPEVIEQQRERFVAGAQKRRIPRETAETIFDRMAKFGEYGFNKSHSLAYAVIAYRTAYLKANYPLEYLAAMLSNDMGDVDKIAQYAAECRRMGIVLLPPDVNASREVFAVEGTAVRYGLAALRNVGRGAAEAIRTERETHGPYTSLEDLCVRLDGRTVNARVIESLAKAGALDGWGVSRAALLQQVPAAVAAAQKSQAEREQGQASLFGDWVPSAGEPAEPIAPPEPENIRLANEKEILGFYLSGHPLAEHQETLRAFSSGSAKSLALAEHEDGEAVVLGGEVVGLRRSLTRRKEPMLRFTLEDMTGRMDVIVWPDVLARQGQALVKGALVFIKGRLDFSGEGVKLIAAEIIPFDEAYTRLSRCLHLTLAATAGEETLTRLRALLQENAGPCPVVLHLQTAHHGEVVERLPETFGVQVGPELLNALRELLGEERVQVACHGAVKD